MSPLALSLRTESLPPPDTVPAMTASPVMVSSPVSIEDVTATAPAGGVGIETDDGAIVGSNDTSPCATRWTIPPCQQGGCLEAKPYRSDLSPREVATG